MLASSRHFFKRAASSYQLLNPNVQASISIADHHQELVSLFQSAYLPFEPLIRSLVTKSHVSENDALRWIKHLITCFGANSRSIVARNVRDPASGLVGASICFLTSEQGHLPWVPPDSPEPLKSVQLVFEQLELNIDSSRAMRIGAMCVDQRKGVAGVASTIIEKSVNIARASGCDLVFAHCAGDKAQSTFEKRGFQSFASKPFSQLSSDGKFLLPDVEDEIHVMGLSL